MIVRNCPELKQLMEWTGEFDQRENPIMTLDVPDYCQKYKCKCKEYNNCTIKELVELCKLHRGIELAEQTLKLLEVEECI